MRAHARGDHRSAGRRLCRGRSSRAGTSTLCAGRGGGGEIPKDQPSKTRGLTFPAPPARGSLSPGQRKRQCWGMEPRWAAVGAGRDRQDLSATEHPELSNRWGSGHVAQGRGRGQGVASLCAPLPTQTHSPPPRAPRGTQRLGGGAGGAPQGLLGSQARLSGNRGLTPPTRICRKWPDGWAHSCLARGGPICLAGRHPGFSPRNPKD